jgi:hypothetical protein
VPVQTSPGDCGGVERTPEPCVMSAYVHSLNVLADNVVSELAAIGLAVTDGKPLEVGEAITRCMEQLRADVREVRADVEQLISGGEW